MALNPPSPFRVRPLPVTLGSIVAIAGFVVVLAVVARLTADGAVIVRSDADGGVALDATDGGPGEGGGDGGVLDGGPPDAGVVVTVEPGDDAGPEPDAGPPWAEPPPYDPAVVAAAAVVVVERCAQDALRWDPSLGGPFTLRIELSAATHDVAIFDEGEHIGPAPRLQAIGLPSPILEACLLRQGPSMARAPGTLELGTSQAVVARGVLRTDGSVEIADPAIVSTPRPADDRRPP